MSAFSDQTLQLINQEIVNRNILLKAFANKYKSTTWDAIQSQVKTGHAADLWPIGTELVCNYKFLNGSNVEVEYEFPWVVAAHRDVYWENDPLPHPGMVLQAKFATVESIQFDAPENNVVDASETVALEGWYYWGLTGSTYTALNLSTGDTIPHGSYDSIHKCGVNHLDVVKYGYNRYLYCAQRQWLNSAAGKGEWWESQHLGDIAPTQHSTYRGFLAGLDEDFLAVINPVKIQVATNTVTDGGVTDVMYDRFFLPSIEEMYGSPQATGIEGDYFPYWKTKTGLSAPNNAANNGRIITAIDNQSAAQTCRLRSANRGYSHGAWSVSTSGQLNYGSSAHNAYRCAPACVIS